MSNGLRPGLFATINAGGREQLVQGCLETGHGVDKERQS